MDITQEHLLKAMPNRGLQTSSWAHNSTRASNTSSLGTSQWSQPRRGDWTCKSCDFSNFQWRDACLRCSASKAPSGMGNGPYICERIHPNLGVPCGTKFTLLYDLQRHEELIHKVRQNADGDAICRGKENERPIHKHTVPVLDEARNTTLPDSHGLLTSRWAPRNYVGRPKRAGGDHVWIKTVPAPISTSDLSQGHAHSIAETPYLDLPYEVQHCILTIIQRILEEGCYDFASRWIPNVLYENKWTCSEAVELSTWRKTLPTSLPHNAITQVNNYTLERALADAVRVRNSAAHRHLESNHELRRMSLHSRDLMSMFSDVSRHEKFVRLWLELNEWETGSRNNEQAARNRLQGALQEIGERPMDDMDWTPNSVSLQEVTEEPLVHEGLGHQALYVDEMEID